MSDTKQILDAINEQNNRLQRIERAILGDKELNQNGIAHDVHEFKEFIAKVKIREAKRRGLMIGTAIGAGSGGAALVEGLRKLFE
jgi:hypothetical protein